MNCESDNTPLLPIVCLCALVLALGGAIAGCSKQAAPKANVPRPRIVTFSPALTSMMFDMGLGDHVVGVTSQCHLPDGQTRQVVGDSYSVNAEAIASVEPDIVMIQQQPAKFDALRKLKPDVKIEHFNIETLDDVAAALERIGKLAGDENRGRKAKRDFEDELHSVLRGWTVTRRPKVLFLIAYEYDKPGTGGSSSFIHEMIQIAGGEDAAGGYKRWANLDASTILNMQPEVLIVWTQPGAEKQAKDYWSHLQGLNLKGGLYVVSDPNWTIPSAKLAPLTRQLFEMIRPNYTGFPTPLEPSTASTPASQEAK